MSTSKKAYLMLFGRSLWGSLNTLYAVLETTQYQPSSIVIMTEEPYRKDLPLLVAGIKAISEAYGDTPHIQEKVFPSGDFVKVGHYTADLVKQLQTEAVQVAVDITSGRKIRTYSTGELLVMTFQIIIGGKRGLRDPNRRAMRVWYDQRREDKPGSRR